MTIFVMKGYKGKTVGCSISHSSLDIKGHFHIHGRHPVCNDGAPEWVYELFEKNPDIEHVSIGTKNSGVVYSR